MACTSVAQELLEEGLRMRLCPGIYFADEPGGRTAKVGGTGLGVWEVLRDFCRDNDLAALGQAFSELSQTLSAHEARKRQATDRAQLEFATAQDRVIATADVVGFVYLSRQAIAANSQHAGIIVVPPSFRGHEFQAIADAIREIVRQYPDGLRGSVVYLQRAP